MKDRWERGEAVSPPNLTPGGFEGFFHEMGATRPAISQNMDAINEAAARFHMTFTGPPLAD